MTDRELTVLEQDEKLRAEQPMLTPIQRAELLVPGRMTPAAGLEFMIAINMAKTRKRIGGGAGFAAPVVIGGTVSATPVQLRLFGAQRQQLSSAPQSVVRA